MPRYTFIVEGSPVAKARARVTAHGAYTPSVQREIGRSVIGWTAWQQGVGMAPKSEPVWLVVDIEVPMPTSWSKAKRLAHVRQASCSEARRRQLCQGGPGWIAGCSVHGRCPGVAGGGKKALGGWRRRPEDTGGLEWKWLTGLTA